jgi:hypothetical protein
VCAFGWLDSARYNISIETQVATARTLRPRFRRSSEPPAFGETYFKVSPFHPANISYQRP